MKTIIVIPVYKTLPDEAEKMSLLQCVKILGRHEMCLVCPQELDVTAYTELAGRSFLTERFERKYFQGIEGYNELMKGRGFYERFEQYEYILIYQLDAWVFEDKLDYWCSKGYDYIGAPWFQFHRNHEEGYDFMCVGNGGLSLRKVSKFLKVTDRLQRLYNISDILWPFQRKSWREYKTVLKRCIHGLNRMGAYMVEKKDKWEDVFFCCELKDTRQELNTPDCLEASLFSIETSPKYIFNEINKGQLPFGCHAWKRYQYEDFWSKYIP